MSATLLSVAVSALQSGRRSSETCGDPANAVPFYRSYSPTDVDHYYTAGPDFVNRFDSGWPLQGVAGFVFLTQEESTVPFYHIYSRTATDNYYTISTTERDAALKNGYINVTNGDPLTYIYPTQVCGSVPFYKLYNPTKLDNFYTTSESERLDFIASQGYIDVEIAGYVLPATPFHTLFGQ
ncbi:hypothetical protein DFH08DRAFT_964710 [Mycena albidolilacea]|uniref:DUF5648 domain-containing protein n=1 Tax=Mycena albidolilacea TaxID=1033008 RepID=A0AAD7ELU3_9AGAR|nr:hypothetical protein DFH08DRAFT_964710 [Mycena albidolilacea]